MRRIFRRSHVRPDARRDVRDELAFHIEMRTREFIEQGMSPEDARRAAAHAFGDVASIDAELRVARTAYTRDVERRDRCQDFIGDLSYAFRTLRKNSGFTIAALATLALGIGAATSVFTVVNGVLLRPLPYADPSRLAMVWLSSKKFGTDLPMSSGFYSDATRDAASIATTAAFRSWGYTLTSNGRAEQEAGARVTPSLFGVLGIRPALGRDFAEADGAAGASHVVILSDALWKRRFGGDPAIVGKHIELGGDPFTVVGVMPEGFAFPRGAELPPGMQIGTHTELWTPLAFSAADRVNYSTENLAAIARIKRGASLAQLREVVEVPLAAFVQANAPGLDLHYTVKSLRDQAGQRIRGVLFLLMAAVALLLVIACANVANLLVARTGARRREFAVRAALGAGRGRIARQLLTENLVIAGGGALIGLGISAWATRAVLARVPSALPRADDVQLDWRVALASLAIAIAVGLSFGLIATWQVRWDRLANTLRENGARATSSRGGVTRRSTLVVAEVSLSLMLLIGAALLATSFINLQRVSPGFDPASTFTANITLPVTGEFNPTRDGPKWAAFFEQLQQRLVKIPGVEAAGANSALPLTDAAEGGQSVVVGEPAPRPGQEYHAQYFVTEGDYFRALRIPLLGGRVFDASDVATGNPVVVVNREYARRYMHGSALNRQIRTLFDFNRGQARTIVGVVDDVQYVALDGTPQPQIYLPESQMAYPALEIVVRSNLSRQILLPAIEDAVHSIDPRLAVSKPRAMSAVLGASLAARRFTTSLMVFFAIAAVTLAMIGLYGVIALTVNERRREVGIRMALGARPADVLRNIIGQGVRITLVGLMIGVVGAALASRFLVSLLYGVSATSVGIYASAAVAVLVVTTLASLIPARRATEVDPTLALRAE